MLTPPPPTNKTSRYHMLKKMLCEGVCEDCEREREREREKMEGEGKEVRGGAGGHPP